MTDKLTFTDLYNQVEALEKTAKPTERPCGIIQWKGTNVCMDIHCPCGYHMHIDDWFCIYVRCSKCNVLYAVGKYVSLIPLNEEQRAYVEGNSPGVIKTDENGQEGDW